jgi:hypothetical protein
MLNTSALFAGGGIVGYLAAHSGVRLLPDYLAGWQTALVVALLPLMYMLGIAAHELGHVLGGRLGAFRTLLFIVGPLRIERTTDGFRPGLNRNILLSGGLAAMTPVGLHDLRRRTVVMIAMGPVVSLMVGAQLLAVYQATSPFMLREGSSFVAQLASLALLELGVISLLVGLLTLVPVRSGGFYSDGARLLRLTKASDEVEREVALIALTGMSMAGTRPREWDSALVEKGSGIRDGGPFEVGGRQFAYAHALDGGDVDAARVHLEAALARIDQLPAGGRSSLLFAAATFYALYDGDVATAGSYLRQARPGMISAPHQRRLAEAAVRLAEGDVVGARAAAHDAQRLAASAMDRGGAALDEALAGRILVSEGNE